MLVCGHAKPLISMHTCTHITIAYLVAWDTWVARVAGRAPKATLTPRHSVVIIDLSMTYLIW